MPTIKTSPRVSVVMPSYNHALFVREAIESVLSQSYQNFELVITDDGSRDGTADVIRQIDDSRIRLNVFAENRGACAAMNDAIGRARGEYVAVLNSDDYFLPGKLVRQVEFLDEYPEIGAVFGLPQLINEHGDFIKNTGHAFSKVFIFENHPRLEWLKQFFYYGNCLCHPTVMIRKACYDRVGRFNPLLMQLPDLDMWVRLCREFEIHVLPEKLTAFRILDREWNVSAPSVKKFARCSWEMYYILWHYTRLSGEEMRILFQGTTESSKLKNASVMLAQEALGVGRPGYIQFGLALLHKCIEDDNSTFSLKEYFELVGKHDPFSAELSGKEYLLFRKTKLPSFARKIVGLLRSIMRRFPR